MIKSRLLRIFLPAAAVLFLPSASNAHLGDPWHGLSQSQRGLKIVSVALTQIGLKAGSCKVWIQVSLLPAATNGHVQIPNNAAEPSSRWKADPTGHVVDLGQSLGKAAAGDIIQMVVRFKDGTPTSHTAVIASINSSSITFVESNFSVANTVTTRKIPKQDFLAKLVDGQFTIYRIT